MTVDAILRDLLGGARKGLFRRCVYCGSRCYGRTCQWHRDLPQLENTVEPAATFSGATAGSDTKGQ